MYSIEKNVPLKKAISLYPFREMEVGDSFFVPAGEKMLRARAAAHGFSKENRPKKFATRTVEGGMRIWRVA